MMEVRPLLARDIVHFFADFARQPRPVISVPSEEKAFEGFVDELDDVEVTRCCDETESNSESHCHMETFSFHSSSVCYVTPKFSHLR